jgi:hypothetical protein
MDENEEFIKKSIPSLLSHRLVKSKTEEIGGEWHLDTVVGFHTMPRNIEFSLILTNGERHLRVAATIRRDTASFSKIVVEQAN